LLRLFNVRHPIYGYPFGSVKSFYEKPTEFGIGIGIGIEKGTMSFVQDVLGVSETISAEQNHQCIIILDRIVEMLTKMGGRSFSVKESEIVYYSGNDDPDPDTNTNKKRTKIFSKKEGGEASLILYN